MKNNANSTQIKDLLVGVAEKLGAWLDAINNLPSAPDLGALVSSVTKTLPTGTKPTPAKAVAAPVPKTSTPAKPTTAKATSAKPTTAKATSAKPTTAPTPATRTKPTLPQAIAIVMGGKTLGTAEVIPLLEARGWAPQNIKSPLPQYLTVIFSTNHGEGKIFERVSTGKYRVQNPAQFTALAKQFGGKASGKADRVTAAPPSVVEEASDPEANATEDLEDTVDISSLSEDENDDPITASLKVLVKGTEFKTDLDGNTGD